MKHYCKNGDEIKVGGVYEFRNCYEARVIACEEIDGDHVLCGSTCYAVDLIAHELPRDIDGYYLWQGKECPVPGDWLIEIKGRSPKYRITETIADNAIWDNIARFRVISTGEDAQEVEQDWCRFGAEVYVKGEGRVVRTITNVTDDRGVRLNDMRWVCRTELEPRPVGCVQEVEPSTNNEQEVDVNALDIQEGPEPSPEINMANTPQGYDDLAYVLVRALEQAALGKGKERHAEDKPFSEQPMQRLIDLYGTGFAFGQAGKKMQESQRMGHDAAIREILGAIVYAAGAIVSMERGE